jgi:hypothetical protein
MNCLPFMLSFVLEEMCGLVKSDIRTDKGCKEIHLNVVAKVLFVHYGANISSIQVYNHLKKWRVK